jgi:hypothetical protein
MLRPRGFHQRHVAIFRALVFGKLKKIMSEWIWIRMGRTKGMRNEANIRDGGKPVHVVFKHLSRSLLVKSSVERAE